MARGTPDRVVVWVILECDQGCGRQERWPRPVGVDFGRCSCPCGGQLHLVDEPTDPDVAHQVAQP